MMVRRVALFAQAGLDVRATYVEHADFVRMSLHRLGARSGELDDLAQEVFVVVARRKADHDPSRPVRPWLYGICVGILRNARRQSARRPTSVLDDEPISFGVGADEALAARRRLRRAQAVLEAMDPERRAVFIMYEVEGMSGESIAETLDIAPGTVHSRLFAARRELAAALEDA